MVTRLDNVLAARWPRLCVRLAAFWLLIVTAQETSGAGRVAGLVLESR